MKSIYSSVCLLLVYKHLLFSLGIHFCYERKVLEMFRHFSYGQFEMQYLIFHGPRNQCRTLSSNINEVIRAFLNIFFFVYEKILHAEKSTKTHQKAPKTTKSVKSIKSTKRTKMQPSKSTKHK